MCAYQIECQWDHFPRATPSTENELACFLFCLLLHNGRQGKEEGKKNRVFKMTKCHCKIMGLSGRLQRNMTKAMNSQKFSSKNKSEYYDNTPWLLYPQEQIMMCCFLETIYYFLILFSLWKSCWHLKATVLSQW